MREVDARRLFATDADRRWDAAQAENETLAAAILRANTRRQVFALLMEFHFAGLVIGDLQRSREIRAHTGRSLNHQLRHKRQRACARVTS